MEMTETTETVTEEAAETVTEEAAETVTEEAAEADDGAVSIADLLTSEMEGDEYNNEHKGLNYSTILAGLPEDARKLLGNLRSSYSQKTAALAEERRQLEALKAEVQRNKTLLLQGEGAKAIKQAALRDLKSEEGFDPWSAEGIEALAEQKAALMLQKYLTAMQEEHQVNQYKQELEDFKTAHPDLMGSPSIKERVTAAMRANPDLRLKDAYWMVKGKASSEQEAALKEEKANTRNHQREVLETISTGRSRGGRKPVAYASAWDAYRAAKAEKEANNSID